QACARRDRKAHRNERREIRRQRGRDNDWLRDQSVPVATTTRGSVGGSGSLTVRLRAPTRKRRSIDAADMSYVTFTATCGSPFRATIFAVTVGFVSLTAGRSDRAERTASRIASGSSIASAS